MVTSEFRIPRLGTATICAGLCMAFAGCASDGGSGQAGSSAAPQSSAAASGKAAVPIDACVLIPAEEISSLLGVSVQGKSTGSDPEMPGCAWENADTYESVSLEIGNPGTAINGTLPPPEPGFPDLTTPGPDKMRFLGNGMVEFPAGGRSNTVQVAVLRLSGDAANSAAVDLARKIGPQLGG
jgi:hypothetical protein